MKFQVQIPERYRPYFVGVRRDSIQNMMADLGGEVSNHRSRTLVWTRTLRHRDTEATLETFVKVYATRKHLVHGIARRSRARREARNLSWMHLWGIPSPPVVAYGWERRLAGCCSGYSFVITESVPDSRPLADYWTGLDSPADSDTRHHLIEQLAKQTRLLHENQFCHQDLKWRNLLVSMETGTPELWWIDCPNGYRSRLRPRRGHGRVKDLATLDKVAKDRCRDEERFAFLRVYLGRSHSDKRVLQWANRVVRYRKRRQDD